LSDVLPDALREPLRRDALGIANDVRVVLQRDVGISIDVRLILVPERLLRLLGD